MLSLAVQTHKHTNIKREEGRKVNMQNEGDQKGQEEAQENKLLRRVVNAVFLMRIESDHCIHTQNITTAKDTINQ